MRIGGFQKLSLIEYPGKISCVVFTIGCNLRCPYCYVPQLVLPEKMKGLKEIPKSEI
ncbi:MAG: anaerobic ribonucleoside-triphosphate reductase activating protein, partial [Thermoplasmata archaeon]